MIMHVLKYRNIDFDYLIGAELEGFDSMIKLTDAPIVVIEGDEYLSSCIDRRPKMLHYKPSMSIITGISWDHVNVFKTEAEYNNLFRDFIEVHDAETPIFAYGEDEILNGFVQNYTNRKNITKYRALEKLENGNVLYDNKQYRIKVFGKHNRANMMAALDVCEELGITPPDFFAAISTFKGAAKRMELLVENEQCTVYRDFAHAPSKVRATVQALQEHYKDRRIIAFLELHTFSSLSAEFLPKYEGTLNDADEAFVYYSAHTLEIKKLPILEKEVIRKAFKMNNLNVVSNKEELSKLVRDLSIENAVIVFMSSGNFDKIDIKGILINKL